MVSKPDGFIVDQAREAREMEACQLSWREAVNLMDSRDFAELEQLTALIEKGCSDDITDVDERNQLLSHLRKSGASEAKIQVTFINHAWLIFNYIFDARITDYPGDQGGHD